MIFSLSLIKPNKKELTDIKAACPVRNSSEIIYCQTLFWFMMEIKYGNDFFGLLRFHIADRGGKKSPQSD